MKIDSKYEVGRIMQIKQIVNMTRRRMDEGVKNVFSKGLRRISPKTTNRGEHLLSMNAPPLAAKLDAACEIAFNILNSDVSNLARTERFRVYERAIQLLNEAIKTNFELACALKKCGTSRQTQSLSVMLELLADMMTAALAALNTQINILDNQQNPLLSELCSSNTSETDVNTQIGLIETETRSAINNLLKTASVIITKEKAKRDFSKEDRERYEKALMEFRRKLG